MKTCRLKRTQQCAKCPWRKSTNPQEIPNGYSPEKHRALSATIAKPGDLSQLQAPTLKIMACHESSPTEETHCIGWLMNQLGPGNNLALRIQMARCENLKEVQILGEQHNTFEETLPTP